MDTQSYAAPLERAPASREQAAPPDRRNDALRGREQRPGLHAVAARWPQLSPEQTRWLYDLVYRRAPEQLRLPVPSAGARPAPGRDALEPGGVWLPVAVGGAGRAALRATERSSARAGHRTGGLMCRPIS
jgi:hypothetical protein